MPLLRALLRSVLAALVRLACVEKLGRARDQEVIDETCALLAGKNVPIRLITG